MLTPNFWLRHSLRNPPTIAVNYIASYDYSSSFFSIEYPPGILNFISCGDTIISKRNLLSILLQSFDEKSWIALLLTFFILITVAWNNLLNNQNRFFSLYSFVIEAVFKNLLEQSTPYTSNLVKCSNLKVL